MATDNMKTRRSEAGQTLAFVTFGLAAFLAAAGLAVDMGYLRYEKRLMQSAADAAALAAATDVNLGNAGNYNADGLTVAQTNGFTNGVSNTIVTVSNPPATLPVSDPNATSANAVEVQVQRALPAMFMKVFGVTPTTISASAVATIGTSNGCMYALQAAGITIAADVNTPTCGVVDNGLLTGAGDITASSVGVLGSTAGYTGVSSPGPEAIVQPAADPLAYLTPPAIGACTQTNFTWTTGAGAIGPGVYCGGISITGGTVTFGSGLYILTGALGLQITGTGGASGNGVTIYNSGTGAITFSGTGSVSLSAPDPGLSGLPAEILIYQDPADVAAADVSLGGSGNAVLIGALYLPTAPLTIAGTLTPGANPIVVAGSITLTGTITMNADSTAQSIALPGGSPLQSVSLVE
jgi:Flp pilus assembly protein TadG